MSITMTPSQRIAEIQRLQLSIDALTSAIHDQLKASNDVITNDILHKMQARDTELSKRDVLIQETHINESIFKKDFLVINDYEHVIPLNLASFEIMSDTGLGDSTWSINIYVYTLQARLKFATKTEAQRNLTALLDGETIRSIRVDVKDYDQSAVSVGA